MKEAPQNNELGYATLSPDTEMVAGAKDSWTVTYIVGQVPLEAGAVVCIYTDSDSDCATPQIRCPKEEDFLSVKTTDGTTVAVIIDDMRTLRILVQGKGMPRGSQIIVTYGDRSQGSPGMRNQTFAEARRYYRIGIDPNGRSGYQTLDPSPWMKIVGGFGDELLVTAPSYVQPKEAFRIQVKLIDRWGNRACGFEGKVNLQSPEIDFEKTELVFSLGEEGIKWVEGCKARETGTLVISASVPDTTLSTSSNPIICRERMPGSNLYWGDFHGGQVKDPAKFEDFYAHARDVASLSFVSFQRNDHEMSTPEYLRQQQLERELYEPGRFVPIPGFEWSHLQENGGHHNVYFYRHDQPIRRCGRINLSDSSDIDTDLTHITALYDNYRDTDTVITPHVGGFESNLDYHDSYLEPALEMSSTHGSFEWFFKDALRRGYRVGCYGGSDSYTGRPGDDRPGYQFRRFTKSGLAAVYAESATISGFLDALRRRHCYGTTGARIIAHTSCGNHMMGDEFSSSDLPTINARVVGTGPIEYITLFRGVEEIFTSRETASKPSVKQVRITWEGSSRTTCYSAVTWVGTLRLSNREIAHSKKLRFDSPRCFTTPSGPNAISWHSIACGYRSGIVMDLDEAIAEDTELELILDTRLTSYVRFGELAVEEGARFRAAEAEGESLTIRLKATELKKGAATIPIGKVGREVKIALMPEKQPDSSVEFSYTDSEPRAGMNPYWIKVEQTDCEKAWTSPIFVDYLG